MVHRRIINIVILFVFLLSVGSLSFAEEMVVHSITIPNQGSLQLQVPQSWQEEQGKPVQGFPTVVFKPASGNPFALLITPMWRPGNTLPLSMDAMKKDLQTLFDRMRDQAVEKTVEIREVRGASGSGCYFTVTDTAPKPGEFRYATTGEFQTGSVLLYFTILTNDGQEGIIATGLSVVQNSNIVTRQQGERSPVPLPYKGLTI